MSASDISSLQAHNGDDDLMKHMRKSKSCRRARLAMSTSSLANITDAAALTKSPKSKTLVDIGKENHVQKKFSKKRGMLQNIDSLVTSFTRGVFIEKKTSSQPLRLTTLENVASFNCLQTEQKKLHKVPDEWKSLYSGSITQNHSPISSSALRMPSNLSFSSNGNNERKTLYRKKNRRGRCNHHLSSLAQNYPSSKSVRRNTAISSLMLLSSSNDTSKQSRTISLNKTKCDMKVIPTKPDNQKIAEKEVYQCFSHLSHVDVSKNSTTEKLNSYDKYTNLSPQTDKYQSLLTHRVDNFQEDCISPPNLVHRLFSITSSNFLLKVATPRSHPKKRVDQKKTPDKIVEYIKTKSINISPLVTELYITPQLHSHRQRKSNTVPIDHQFEVSKNLFTREQERSIEEHENTVSFDTDDIHAENSEIGDEISHTGVEPRDLLASHDGECLYAFGENEDSIHAKINLFPTNPYEQQNTRDISTTIQLDRKNDSSPLGTDRSKSPLSAGLVVSTSDDKIRGSAVLSLKKAPVFTTKFPLNHFESIQTVSDVTSQSKTIINDDKIGNSETKIQISECFNPKEIEPRRSFRQSKKTDRLTVTSWCRERADRKVRFNKSSCTDVDVKDGFTVQKPDLSPPPISDRLPTTTNLFETSTSLSSVLPCKQQVSDSAYVLWTVEEITMLREAQKHIDPTLITYWEDVSRMLKGKSASECREKWFSLVATPRSCLGKGNKMKDNVRSRSSRFELNDDKLDDASFDNNEEDDLFNSTPLREAILHVQSEILANDISRISFGTSLELSPCEQPDANSHNIPIGNSTFKERRKGYKTYLDKLRKDLKHAHKNSTKEYRVAVKKSQTIYLESGTFGKLMPDGTFNIVSQEQSDIEDDFFDEEEEED